MNDDSSMTWRDHYESIWKDSGIKPRELNIDGEIPELLEYIMMWFSELNNSRSGGMGGPEPITYQEIMAWSYITNRKPEYWEVLLIKRLDIIYINAQHKKAKTRKIAGK